MRMTDISSRCSTCGRDVDVRKLRHIALAEVVSKSDANYTDFSEDDSRTCSKCIHFEPSGECSVVTGDISPDGTCDGFSSSQALADERRRRKAGLNPAPIKSMWPVNVSEGPTKPAPGGE